MRARVFNLLSSLKNIFLVGCYLERDRLSSLPDDLIHKILSFIGVKDAIMTSALSSRWRYIWTSMPYLHFSDRDMFSSHSPSKFVKNVLTHRNNRIGLCSLSLSCKHFDMVFVQGIVNYASCYNIQQLTLACFCYKSLTFPVSQSNFKYLKHLTLSGVCRGNYWVSSSKWELLALTSLDLKYVTLYNDNTDKCNNGLFSKCVNLRSLALNECVMKGSGGFRICHPRLSNLTIIHSRGKLFKGRHALQISIDSLHSLEKLYICIVRVEMAEVSEMFGLFQHLHGVKFLRLNLELVLFLFSSMNTLISTCPPSPFANLKRLMIDPVYMYLDEPQALSSEIKNYFLDGSSDVSFTLILRKDGRVRNNIDPEEVQVEMQRAPQMRHSIRTWTTAKIKSCFKY